MNWAAGSKPESTTTRRSSKKSGKLASAPLNADGASGASVAPVRADYGSQSSRYRVSSPLGNRA